MSVNESSTEVGADLIGLAADLVSAYVSKNTLPARDLAPLVSSVHAALAGLGTAPIAEETEVQTTTPAQIRKSITPDGIISFLDGRAYKSLRRHLTANGLSPEDYSTRYSLPSDYPMVAANYAAQRSALAKQIGLGRSGSQAQKLSGRKKGYREHRADE